MLQRSEDNARAGVLRDETHIGNVTTGIKEVCVCDLPNN